MNDLGNEIDELSRTTDRIEELNPNSLDELAEAITARSRVMMRIHQVVVDGEAGASPVLLDRLTNELERGSELIRRLKIVQARLRSEYRQGRERRHVLGGIREHSTTGVTALDIQG